MDDKVTATPAALALLAEIVADHGPVLFHQSGGCCDGSSPMCYPQGEFLIGDCDVLLGEIGGTPFYIGGAQFEVWKHTELDHRRRAGPRRHVLARQRPRATIPHPVDPLRGSRQSGAGAEGIRPRSNARRRGARLRPAPSFESRDILLTGHANPCLSARQRVSS